MKVTVRQMRKSVREWLWQEKATIRQALQLQSALEAGAIAGDSYQGRRSMSRAVNLIDKVNDAPAPKPDEHCSCLLGTFERIKDGAPLATSIDGASAETFALALMLTVGDTPSNNAWAAAAVVGIEDYVLSQELIYVE
jgi:hypothetical protein